VAEDGSNLGVIPTEQALRRAQEVGLDLVEVNPKSSPPVCKILDFGKFKYEEKKKQREAKRKQTVVEVKEIKIRPKTDDHDIGVKIRAIRKFIEGGNKVKVTCRFRGREIMHPQIAQRQLEEIAAAIEDLANVEQRPTMEARTMSLVVSPKPIVFQRLASHRSQKEREQAKGQDPDRRPTRANADEPSSEDHEPEDADEDEEEEEEESDA